MARPTYRARSDAEDARLWRDLMAYFDAWPHSPYTDIEMHTLADRVRALRSSQPTLGDLAIRAREALIRYLLSTDDGTRALADSLKRRGTQTTEPMKSAYDGISPAGMLSLTREQRAKLWQKDRATIAHLWFDGDEDQADAILDALPYSAIPSWADVDRVMRTITGAGADDA